MPAPPEESRGAPEVIIMVDSNEAAEPATAFVQQQGNGGAATKSSLVPYVLLVWAFCAIRHDQLETLVQQQQRQADGNLEWVWLCQATLL